MLVPLYVVQYEHGSIARRQLVHSTLEVHTVQRTGQLQVRRAEISPRSPRFVIRFGYLLERSFLARFLPQFHQYDVDRQAVKPSGKRRLAAKSGNFAKELQERFLR